MYTCHMRIPFAFLVHKQKSKIDNVVGHISIWLNFPAMCRSSVRFRIRQFFSEWCAYIQLNVSVYNRPAAECASQSTNNNNIHIINIAVKISRAFLHRMSCGTELIDWRRERCARKTENPLCRSFWYTFCWFGLLKQLSSHTQLIRWWHQLCAYRRLFGSEAARKEDCTVQFFMAIE